MDEIQLSIVAAWKRLLPKLLDDPHQFHSRLKRNASFLRPPRPWCLAIRANDTRLPVGWPAPAPHDAPPRCAHFITRDDLVRLCSPVHLRGTGHTIEQVASLLGVTRGSLLTSRVKGLFKTTHLPALDGRWGKPHPLLSCSLPLDPSIRGFVSADPLWSWTSTFLTSRIPADLPTQTLVRIPRYHDRTAAYRDTDPLHPEHPLLDPQPAAPRSRALPKPRPDDVWYKWKDGIYVGHDWRNPQAVIGYHRREQRLALARAAAKARRKRSPRPSSGAGSLESRGHQWLCPLCGKPVQVLFLPLPPIHLLDRELAVLLDQLPQLKTDPLVKRLHQPPSVPFFGCSKCHQIRRFSFTRKSAWNDIIRYLTAGLLFGHEVPCPSTFQLKRKKRYAPMPNRAPSRRRMQIEALMLKGMPIQQIADELKLSKGTILSYSKQVYQQQGVKCLKELLIKHGLPIGRNMRGPALGKRGDGRVSRKRKPPRLTIRQQVQEWIESNKSPQQIAAALDLPLRRVLDHLAKLRRANRIAPEFRLRKRGITPEIRKQIRDRLADGKSAPRIAKELNVTFRAVYNQKWVMRNGEPKASQKRTGSTAVPP